MPFIGKTPETGAFRLIDSITTSATDTYALTVQGDHYFPESARNLIVSLNGVTQAPETAYTVSGSHIVFASALTSSDVIDYILVIGDAVDIGTPSDGTVGNAQLKASLDLSGKTLTFSNDQISGDVIHGGTISNFASTGIDDNATSTAITIDSSERVGIGTTSPARLLTLSGSGATLLSLVSTNDDNCQVLFGDSASDTVGKVVYAHDTNHMRFETNSAERMRIDSSGNLLVGTTDSAFVNGGGIKIANDTAARLKLCDSNSAGTGSADGFELTQSGLDAYIYQNENSFMAFGTNATERMRIDSAGRLLIGQTSTTFRDDGCVFGASNADVNGWSAWIAATPGSGGGVLAMNRDGSDGEQIRFHKNGAGFASIGNNNGDEPYFARSVGTTSGIKIANGALTACQSNGTDHDAAQNLGSSTIRWGNLFLSGGWLLRLQFRRRGS